MAPGQIYQYTQPQSRQRALYSKDLDYYRHQELLLEHKKNKIKYKTGVVIKIQTRG